MIDQGSAALGYERKSIPSLLTRGNELVSILQGRHRDERLTVEFHERLLFARRAMAGPESVSRRDTARPPYGDDRDV